jgi:hypothetical protein
VSESTPALVAPAIRVHAEAVVIRNGVPIDDDGNPIPTTSTEE